MAPNFTQTLRYTDADYSEYKGARWDRGDSSPSSGPCSIPPSSPFQALRGTRRGSFTSIPFEVRPFHVCVLFPTCVAGERTLIAVPVAVAPDTLPWTEPSCSTRPLDHKVRSSCHCLIPQEVSASSGYSPNDTSFCRSFVEQAVIGCPEKTAVSITFA
jgi:hypothetical protein